MTRTASPLECTLQLRCGRSVDLLRPDLSGVPILDLAWSLGQIPRWCGHTVEFYSVAQHCLHVAKLVERAGGSRIASAYALAHDMAKAFTGELPGPVKLLLGERWRFIERGLQDACCRRIRLPGWPPDPHVAELVEAADLVAQATEARDLRPQAWSEESRRLPPPDRNTLEPWPATVATARWLQAARLYGIA